jgi:hypothetical protein
MRRLTVYKGCLLVLLAALFATGCKKTTTTELTNTSDSATQTVIVSDVVNVNMEIGQAIDEAVAALSISSTTSGGPANNATLFLSPGVLVDTSQISTGLLYVDYFVGKSQDSAVGRSGTVQIQLPVVAGHITPWKKIGTGAVITFTNATPTQDYEAVYFRPVPNPSLWFTGSLTVTNYSGGLLKNLIPGDSLVEKVNGQIQYTNNDNGGAIILWTVNLHYTRLVGMTNTNHITITTRADTNINSFNNVIYWGQDRFNDNFYTSLTVPTFQDISSAASYNPLSGVTNIQNIKEPITCTYGVSLSGNPVVNAIPYGYKINWTYSGTAEQDIISY